MDAFRISGGFPLSGEVRVNGAKNAALPQMAASLLTDRPVTLHEAPRLSDLDNMARLLGELGVETRWSDASTDQANRGGTLHLCAIDETKSHARYDIVRTMRASICVLGPLLARRGEARVSMPGGCVIGDRPIDLHLRGLRALGAEITLDAGDIVARAPKTATGERRLRGARVFMGGAFGSTVLGTANLMSAATLARGETVIECAACEPEIADLAALLKTMGARITGAGAPRIIIEGVDSLTGVDHTVIPDRIEAGTLLAAIGATNGDAVLRNCPYDAMAGQIDRFEEAGLQVELSGPAPDMLRASVRVRRRTGAITPARITTQPHPGFPTDVQAQAMAMLALGKGISVVTEKIFPERFLHVAELSRMGASLFRQGPTVVVNGVDHLVGAPVMASDIRASAGLVVAGLAAKGETTVRRVYHLDRGYESLERCLRAMGARIERIRGEAVVDDLAEPAARAATMVGDAIKSEHVGAGAI